MNTRVRFAPSPTGQVHIGNIRTAIFNWLFARNTKGKFLLRIEDTDRERSSNEAIEQLLIELQWLKIDYDEQIFYQSSRFDNHNDTAKKLLHSGKAYRFAKGEGGEATLFRIPWDAADFTNIRDREMVIVDLHPEVPVKIDYHGISYAQISKKGKPIPVSACLAGYRRLEIFDQGGNTRFQLDPEIEKVLIHHQNITINSPARMTFLRRDVVFTDLIKGELAKPLDSMNNLVIVRSDGTPVFHLANVCDDIEQKISHIIRGDDHIENTYRHILLFQALGVYPPAYAHLPMIVNSQGKPYSKRDGDAYTGQLREHGYLSEVVFN